MPCSTCSPRLHVPFSPLVHLTGTFQSLRWDPQVGPNTFHDLPRTTRDSEGLTRWGTQPFLTVMMILIIGMIILPVISYMLPVRD
jgi:hypothetical protein